MLPVVFPDSGTVWVFCLTAVALLVIPGPAVLYVVVQGAEQGRRVGLASVLGIHLGDVVEESDGDLMGSATTVQLMMFLTCRTRLRREWLER